MTGPQANRLGDGRLHLHHGPIDLIIEVWGEDRVKAYAQAEACFATILVRLVEELPALRQPLVANAPLFRHKVARRMAGAVAPFQEFITPMAAVAGAVADEVLAAITRNTRLDKACVNNGGDIAFYLAPGQDLAAAIHDGSDAGRVRLAHGDGSGGLATSGWRGRSHSLGIADAVTVVAKNAAAADAAATLIANAVDLPGHPAIRRAPARSLAPDSDLGDRPVTVGVGPLLLSETGAALDRGVAKANTMLARGLILGAALFLNRQVRTTGSLARELTGDHDARLQIA